MTVWLSIIIWCSIIIHVLYTLYVLKYFGITHDFSCTYYYMERQKKGRGKLFSILLLLIIVFIIPIWIIVSLRSASPRSVAVLPALVGLCLAVVMFTPRYKRRKWLVKLHYSAAIIAAVLTILWIMAACPKSLIVVAVLFTILTVLAVCTRTLKTSTLFWLELLAFYSVYIILLIQLYSF